MNNNYFLLIGLLIAGILQINSSVAGAETIRMGYFELSPHMYTSATTGLPAGASVTFFERVAKKMGYDVVWVGPIPHSRLVSYMEKGIIVDGDPIMSKTSKREAFLYYPEEAFYFAKPNFIVTKNNPLTKIDSADDVKGYVIGQFFKAANSKFVIENKAFFKFDIISSGEFTFRQNLEKLLLGRIDAIHTLDEFTLLYEASKQNTENRIKILLLPESPVPFYSVFCKNEKGKILARKYDIAIKEFGLYSNQYIELIRDEFNMLEKNKHIQTAD